MKSYRVVSIALPIFFSINLFTPTITLQSQSPFDGVVTYIGVDGNIYTLWENGLTQQVTFDAMIAEGQDGASDKIWYDCLDLFEDKKHLFFTRRTNKHNTPDESVFYDLSNKTVIYSSPTEDRYCNSFPGIDEKGLFYEIDEMEELPSGDIIERGYTQYISGERELNYEYTTKALYSPVIARFHNMAVYEENPYEIVFYNFNTREYLRINTPIEKFLEVTRLSDDEIIFSSYGSDVIITVNLQSKQVEQWGFALYNARIIDMTERGYYLVVGSHGDGTPTSLYKVDLNRQSSELLYSPSSPVEIWVKTSPDYNSLSILEESADYIGFSNLTLLPAQGSPIKISSSADFYYEWSKDSQKIYFIQMTQLSADDYALNRELMVYDRRAGNSSKILDMVVSDMSSEAIVIEPIDWVLNDSALPETTPGAAPYSNANSGNANPAEQSNPQSQPPVIEPLVNPDYTPILLIGGIGMVVLLGLGAGTVWWMTRPKSRKPNAPALQKAQVTSSPASPQLQAAVRLAKEKRFQESFEMLRDLLKSEGNNPEVWYYLGYDLVNMGDFVNAEKCFLRAKKYGHSKADHALNWIKNNQRQ